MGNAKGSGQERRGVTMGEWMMGWGGGDGVKKKWVTEWAQIKSVLNQGKNYPCPRGAAGRKKKNVLQAEMTCERKQWG